MIGKTLSHYLIERSLGAGGMGVVYLARDLALGRRAAVKVVTDTFDCALRERLLREAEACARLQHPAIATFYESGETENGVFIAMEYVRGQTLRDRLAGGRLRGEEILQIACALLEALNHAHAAGILHRDIKPENIMLTEAGSPKLLDFGLAQVAPRADQDETVANLTAGHVLGTVGYMSPEQLRGEPLDERSDIFSFGAVLYEMTTGRPAFPGTLATERIAAILGNDPEPVAGPGIPSGLSDVIMRALRRDRSMRYASASAMLSELRALETGERAVPLPQSLAVVDLRNLSGTPENDWIGSGIAESLATDLARLPGLTVVSRENVLRTVRQLSADGRMPDALEVGRLLGCRWVLSGSFQRAGGAVRITTTLIEVATGDVSAAEKLDGSIDGIFDLQDRLSRAVANSLHLRLPTDRPVRDDDVQAFELYARGRRLWQRLEKGSLDQAGELYRRAIAIQPSYPQALCGLAALHAMRFPFTTDPRDLEMAVDYARRAIDADRTCAESYVWLGYAYWREGRADEALEAELRALDLDPDLSFATYFAGCVEVFRGRHEAALPYLQRTVSLDPMHGFAWLGLAIAHLGLGNPDEARWCAERAVALEGQPSTSVTSGARVYLAECFRLSGDLAGARRVCLEGLDDIERSDHMYRDTFRGIGLCVLGRTALDQGDTVAARAAFHQSLAQLAGRERTLGGGFLAVQAMAGLARAGEGETWLREALRLYTERTRLNFALTFMCSDDVTLVELARAALHAGSPDASDLLKRACDAGSFEARRLAASQRS
jgi:serine/threonine protein kinase/tetratricopeptide (TPR) repeat protein